MKKQQVKKVCVRWMDAAGGQKIDKSEIKSVSPKDLLVVTETYGILYKEDDLAILILQEDSVESVDYTVIPKSWILKIQYLK